MGFYELDESGPPPTFVMSHDRSGSTLLRVVLDTHSEICCPGELLVAPTARNVLFVIENTLGVAVADLTGEAKAADRAVEARRIINGIMRSYARAKGKARWCEKWPGSSKMLAPLQRVFPDAKYICLYRDCLDTVDSCIRTYGRFGFSGNLTPYVTAHPENLVHAATQSWLDEYTRVHALEESHPSQCHRVRYEDLIADPPGVLQPMFEFIGVAWEPEIVTKVFEAQHDSLGRHGDESVTTKKKFDASSIGVGIERIPLDRIPKPLAERVNELATKLGYEPLGKKVAKAKLDASSSKPRTVAQEALDVLVEKVFTEKIPATLKANATQLAGRNGTIRFLVTDGQPRDWFVTFDGGSSSISHDGKGASTVVTDQTMLLELAGGRANIIEAFRDGRVGLEGLSAMGLLGLFF